MSDSVYELAQENLSSKSLISSKTSVNSKKSSIVSCRICLSNILSPASLVCGHKFCERCLKKYWDVKDRPDFIACPLCRTTAFKIDFTKKPAPSSTEDFRKIFNPFEDIAVTDEHNTTVSCFKFSIVLLGFYYLLKWLGLPTLDLFTCLRRL